MIKSLWIDIVLYIYKYKIINKILLGGIIGIDEASR